MMIVPVDTSPALCASFAAQLVRVGCSSPTQVLFVCLPPPPCPCIDVRTLRPWLPRMQVRVVEVVDGGSVAVLITEDFREVSDHHSANCTRLEHGQPLIVMPCYALPCPAQP